MKKNLKILGYLILIGLIASCEKPEGVGGEGVIEGTVSVEYYDKEFKVLQSSQPAVDEDVFIVYGDDDVYDDDVTTSFNGKYRFEYLSKGDYSLYVYSEDMERSSLQDIKIDTLVSLSNNDEELANIDLTIYKTLDYDDGNASIKGKIYQINYSKDFIYIIDTTRAQEQDVYLVYENGDVFIDRTRTLDDGSFEFSGLLKGSYKIIAYSEDLYGGTEKIVKSANVSIEGINDIAVVDNIFVGKED